MKKNILVGQSGGPTAVINASLYGVIAEGMARPEEVDHVYGMVNGIEGFLSGHVTDLSLLTREDLSLLKQTPAAYLGSCRFKLPENLDAPVYSLLFEKFTAMNIGASVYQQPAVTIVELMGRHAGWVTAASALARKYPGDNPLLIYMPEVPFSMEQFFKDVEQALSRQPNVVICVSEGIRDKKGRFICEYTNDAQIDTFGHKMLTGCAKILESYVRNRFRVKVRSVELNVNQRCSSLLASAADVEEAECSGRRAAEKALQGETGKMVTCSRLSGPGYELEYGLTEVGNVCNREKSFPVEWITAEGSDIGPEFLDYALPLIQGQPDHIMENGLPKYLYRK